MGTLTMEQLSAFQQRYAELKNALSHEHFQRFASEFNRLKVPLQALLEKAEEHVRVSASTFNIFHLLGVARVEVGTHSAVIADLLNPTGRHAQKHLFLEEFLRICATKHGDLGLPAGAISSKMWVVEKEKVTAFGNMDVVASCPPLGFLLVIENKVDAYEQEEQMARYAVWMERCQRRYPNQLLVYLTPGGVPSYTIGTRAYLQLSYHDDIAAWLDKSLTRIEAPRLRETIAQYLEVIRAL